MKKLLLGTLVLLAFNAAIIITQMSCKKEAMATASGVSDPTVQYNRLLVFEATPDSTIKKKLTIRDYDGKLISSIVLDNTVPAGYEYFDSKISPDGKTIFMTLRIKGQFNIQKIASVNVDGTGFKVIHSNEPDVRNHSTVEAAY